MTAKIDDTYAKTMYSVRMLINQVDDLRHDQIHNALWYIMEQLTNNADSEIMHKYMNINRRMVADIIECD